MQRIIDSSVRERTDIVAFVTASMKHEFASRFGSGLSYTFEADDNAVFVSLDMLLFEKALVTLIEKETRTFIRGRVRITLQRHQRVCVLSVCPLAIGEYEPADDTACDSACPVGTDVAIAFFEEVARIHGGTFSIAYDGNGHDRFVFSLPLADARGEADVHVLAHEYPPALPQPAHSEGRKQVIVADDRVSLRTAIAPIRR